MDTLPTQHWFKPQPPTQGKKAGSWIKGFSGLLLLAHQVPYKNQTKGIITNTLGSANNQTRHNKTRWTLCPHSPNTKKNPFQSKQSEHFHQENQFH
jgi:hypothetical protein